jgi:tetratricopeptide (TPR) repeat protein
MGLFGFGKSKEEKDAKYWINKANEETYEKNPDDEKKVLYFENALTCCNNVLKNNPDDNLSLRSKTESLLFLRRYAEAIECCDKFLEKKTNNEILLFKSMALSELGRYEDAISCCDDAIKCSSSSDGFYAKATILEKIGRYEDAIKCYDDAIKIGTEDDDVWADKMSALAYVDRYEEAIECCNQIIKIGDNDEFAFGFKSMALSELGRYEDAIKCYDKELKIGTEDDGEIWKCKGNMFSKLGRYEDAIKCYEKSAKINPDDEIWIYMAYALSELGLNEQAENYFNKLDYADGFNVRADVLFELGKYEDAINQANNALKINPFMFTSFLMIANSLSKLGKYQESIPWYNKYIEKMKTSSRESDVDLVFHPKGIALFKLGRKDEAIECWKKSKEFE